MERTRITNLHELQMECTDAACEDCGWYGPESDLTDYDDDKLVWRCPACDDGHVAWCYYTEIDEVVITEIAEYFSRAAVWIHLNQSHIQYKRYFPTVLIDAQGRFSARLYDSGQGIAGLNPMISGGYEEEHRTSMTPEEWNIGMVRCWIDDWERIMVAIESEMPDGK